MALASPRPGALPEEALARGRPGVSWPKVTRRSSYPSIPIPEGAVHGTRRVTSRSEASERVHVRGAGVVTAGWTLNVSRGGARLVLEEPVQLDHQYEVAFGTDATARPVVIVWAQDEADGQIVGVRFLDVEGTVPPPPGKGLDQPPGTG